MSRVWRCRKITKGVPCSTLNLRVKQRCTSCGGPRPKARPPAHRAVLEQPYEKWVELFGEVCGICGVAPGDGKRLRRDHDHKTGEARGILCVRCNRALPDWLTVEWLRAAIKYLTRPRKSFPDPGDARCGECRDSDALHCDRCRVAVTVADAEAGQ